MTLVKFFEYNHDCLSALGNEIRRSGCKNEEKQNAN